MTLILVLLAELALLAWALKRSGFMLFPHGFMVYVIGAQITLWLNYTGLLRYEFLQIWTSGAYERYFREIVVLFFAFYVGAAACVPRSGAGLRTILSNVRIKADADVVSALLIAALYVRLLMHLAVLDWSVMWHSEIYLEMSYVDELGAIGRTLTQSARVFGVVAAILAAYLFSTRRMSLFTLVLPLVMWHVLFDLAAHSRSVVFYFAAAGATLVVLQPKKLGAPGLMLGLALLTLVGSLAGRGSGHHGFSSLPFYLTNIVNFPLDLGNLTNIFEGIFVTAEYFAQDLDYHSSYANLSLSPLVSALDGYDLALERYQIRLGRYAPNSAVTEVLAFGPFHSFIFFGTEFLAGWLSARLLARDRSPVALIINAVVLLACYLQFTYSSRVVFRFLTIAAAAAAVTWFYSSQKSRMESVAPALPVKPEQRRKALASGGASPARLRHLVETGIDGNPSHELSPMQARRRRIAALGRVAT